MKPRAPLNPGTITVLDPACGSGHILVEAYEVLKPIYLERGYRMRDIPRLILEKNLYGLDIDDRAAQLAGFALLMKARADDRRLLDNPPKLNILALQDSKGLNAGELAQALVGWVSPQRSGGRNPTTRVESVSDAQAGFVGWADAGSPTLLPKALGFVNSAQPTIASLLETFTHALTFGSLIQIPEGLNAQLPAMEAALQQALQSGDLLAQAAAYDLLTLVRQARILGMRFNAVVANPPYMGGKGMNVELKDYAKRTFPDSKSDLFAMFIERCSEFGKHGANLGLVTPYTWMFISSYEKLRDYLFTNQSIDTLVKPSYTCFFESAIVALVAFTTKKSIENIKGTYFDLGYLGSAESQPIKLLESINSSDSHMKYLACHNDFKKIPSSPLAYWASDLERNLFINFEPLEKTVTFKEGITTANNDLFLRYWYEIDFNKITINADCSNDNMIWVPYNKGGAYRKWYGNNNYVVDWRVNGSRIKDYDGSSFRNASYHFKNGATFSTLSSSGFSVRYSGIGFSFDSKGTMLFAENYLEETIVFLNSKVCARLLQLVAPTLDYRFGTIQKIPFLNIGKSFFNELKNSAEQDWNNYEISWDFTENPLIRQKQNTVGWVNDSACAPEGITQQTEATDVGLRDNAANPTNASTSQVGWATLFCPPFTDEMVGKKACPPYTPNSLEHCFNRWQTQNRASIVEMQRLEQENNRLFIEAYGLQDELSPEVPEDQITLTRADREKDCQRLVSYAIGCMMGRYRLDRPGLIYAHAGNVDFDKIYYGMDPPPFEKGGPGGISQFAQAESQEQIPPNPPFSKGGTFAPDADGIVPITDELWFEDDAANRIREFLLAVWGNPSPQPSPQGEGVEANLAWLAESLGQKANETSEETIRRYLSGSFFKDHLQTYKKRPIYWLFSSGKQGAFQALVYLHRYHEGTLARMRAEYVVPLTGKIQSRIEMLEKDAAAAPSNAARSKLNKDIEKLKKKHVELLAYDEKLRHYADLRIQLDLDDGVKVNYGKFGDLLAEVKAVTGGKDE